MTANPTLTGQQIAARALLDLLGRDLPGVTWTLCLYTGLLSGQPDHQPPLADRRAAITRYAEVLDATPEVHRYRNPTPDHAGHLGVDAEYLGARIRVWVALTEADVAELDAEQAPAVADA
ncbi:hypothetical protein OIE13_06185 [Streptosporangium sp. NBC_01810]|uniref:hypothetical protein n=1 Tax=Streptosporangium sp. NBC_01810 TaxID=2975951 RepID=UPI002DD9DF63|nr:hypothetical protein [Streptosporangium sp. NBC_01810]WSA27463.1 hypothetical protein OIE13_06185 [Streptosporangium sp. NBC_01810]